MSQLTAALSALPALGPDWLQPAHVITMFGPWAVVGVALLVFAETGLLLGFFLPGDTLLFTTGLLTTTGAVGAPLWVVCLALVAAAVAGGECGYFIGRSAGRRLLARSRLVSPEQLGRTDDLVARHGRTGVVAARFIPVVRTLAPVVAGAARMPARTYSLFNAIGAALWVLLLTLVGAKLGQVPAVRTFVTDRLDDVIIGVVVLSLLLTGAHLVRQKLAARRCARRGEHGPDEGRDDEPPSPSECVGAGRGEPR